MLCACFLAFSPVYWFKDNLIEIGTKLKKTGVAVDVVNFGDKDGPKGGVLFEPYVPLEDYSYPGESKKENLEALVIAANDNDNSYILHVPEDQQLSLREHLS
ncbi:26S proteasome non-ATPase regulatory subunit 4, partial [Tanacetum coccineum]